MQSYQSILARHFAKLRLLKRVSDVIFPVISEVQWVVVATVLICQAYVARDMWWVGPNSSWISTVLVAVGIAALLWLLYIDVLQRKHFSHGRKFVMSAVYYVFYALFAGIVLWKNPLPEDGWWQTFNYALVVGMLGVSIIRGLVIFYAAKMNSMIAEAIIANRMSDLQYPPLLLIGVSALVPCVYYLLNTYASGGIPAAFLTAIYVGIFAHLVEYYWLRSSTTH